MNRTTAITLVLAASGLIVSAPFVARSAQKDRDSEQERARSPGLEPGEGAGALRGFADADFIPRTVPFQWDTAQDRIERPYHLLIRVLRFSDLEPLDVDPSLVAAGGVPLLQHLGPGTFFAPSLDVAMTWVTVKTTPRPPVPGEPYLPQSHVLATRNPVSMARHSITTCDVIAVEEEDLDDVIEVKGVVYDRFGGFPIEGAQVVLRGSVGWATTDAEGRFDFVDPMSLGDALGLTVIAESYRPYALAKPNLTRTWVESWRSTGEMTLTLVSEEEKRTYRPLLGGGD